MDLLNVLPFLSLNTSRTISIHFTSAQNSLFREKSSAVPIVQQMCVLKVYLSAYYVPFFDDIVGHLADFFTHVYAREKGPKLHMMITTTLLVID